MFDNLHGSHQRFQLCDVEIVMTRIAVKCKLFAIPKTSFGFVVIENTA